MRGFGQDARNAKIGSWICQKCLQGREARTARASSYPSLRAFRSQSFGHKEKVKTDFTQGLSRRRPGLSKDPILKYKGKRRRRLLVFTGIVGVASVFASTDTARHAYAASIRSLRVASALIRSVRELVLRLLL